MTWFTNSASQLLSTSICSKFLNFLKSLTLLFLASFPIFSRYSLLNVTCGILSFFRIKFEILCTSFRATLCLWLSFLSLYPSWYILCWLSSSIIFSQSSFQISTSTIFFSFLIIRPSLLSLFSFPSIRTHSFFLLSFEIFFSISCTWKPFFPLYSSLITLVFLSSKILFSKLSYILLLIF